MKTKIIAVLVMAAVSFGWNVEAQIYDTNSEVTFKPSPVRAFLVMLTALDS